jgi:signal transduction histidine kinase
MDVARSLHAEPPILSLKLDKSRWMRSIRDRMRALSVPQRLALLCLVLLIVLGTHAWLSGAADHSFFYAFAIAGALGVLMLLAQRQQDVAIAAMRAAQERLAARAAMLQDTIENMGEGISLFDRNGRLVAWNSQFARYLKLSLDLSKATLHDIMLGQALRGDFGPVEDPRREARERAEAFYRELPTVIERATRSGHTLQIRRRAMPDGGVVSVYSDITEQKASVEKVEQARIQAELANRAKSDFLANMSHELRTPLNAIIGFSEVISSEILGPVTDKRQLEYIKDIHSSGLLLLSIINDVLDMSKIEAGKLELLHERVVIQTIIGDAIRIVGERARERGVAIVPSLPAEPVAISGDERAIKQIMLNLLSNAVKFSHANGQVDVRLGLDRPGTLILEVADYGIGMTADEMERALQPFGQAKPATIRTYGGTGLGLPIARGLAQAHGGGLELESEPGRGTLVRILLPRKTEIPQPIEALLQELG